MCSAPTHVRYAPIADILVRALLQRGTARAAALPSDRPAKIGHSRNYLPKQKGRLTAASPKSDSLQLSLPSGLNNWSFTLADRSLADTTSKAKGQYGRADHNQKFFHGSPISLFYQNLFLSYARIKLSIESGLLHRFALSCDKNVTRVIPDTALTFGHGLDSIESTKLFGAANWRVQISLGAVSAFL